MTEFGFVTFPATPTVSRSTQAADRENALTAVMKAHQHNGNKSGNVIPLRRISRYFRPENDFDCTLRLSQINQTYGAHQHRTLAD